MYFVVRIIGKELIVTLLRIISGAKYSGVPHNVHVRSVICLANPKSVTCKMLNGLLTPDEIVVGLTRNCIVS